MKTIRFTIYGNPYSKANSRKMVKIKGKTRFIKSDKARAYAESAQLQIPAWALHMLTGKLRVSIWIFYASERPDLDESIILDVMQPVYAGSGENRRLVRKGVYHNDRQVREKHVYHGIDRKNPRAVIEVTEIDNAGAQATAWER